MSAACWFADILAKEKKQQNGNVLCIADYKLEHQKADKKVSNGAKMPDVSNKKLPQRSNKQN